MIFRARHVILTIGLMGIVLSNASGAPNTLTVQGARPVAKAIEEFDKRYGWQITYEDLPLSHWSDMPDVTPFVRENGSIAPGTNRTSVLEGSLSFALPSAGQDQASVVEALVKSYNASRGGNVFAIVHGVGLLHVVPRKVTGLSGYLEPMKPVLDTVITVEPKERTAFALLEEVCRKISIGTNTTVDVGTVPTNMLIQTKTSIGGSRKTARSILEQWILESGAPLSWQLFYGPDNPKGYALKTIVRRGSIASRSCGLI